MRTTFELNASLHDAFEAAIVRDHYSQRKKSRWICEAIMDMRAKSPMSLLSVGLGEAVEPFDRIMAVTLSQEAQDEILHVKKIIRRHRPQAEGLNGQIIRAAIRVRIARA